MRYGTDKNGRIVKKAVVYTEAEHSITNDKIDPDAIQIVNRLKDVGFVAYIVGGAVRDLLIDNKPKDFDIVTDATPSKIKKVFRNSRIIGRRFRLVHVVFGEKIFEVSTFRSISEGSVGNNFGTIDEDVQRRDFSINALYYDPIQKQVIDYVGGVEDIRKHILKPVIPVDKIFVEDPVRMLRAIKYSATANVKISFSLRHKIRVSSKLLSQISPSRLTEELLKIINSSHSFDIINEAIDTDLFMYLQPAATSMMFNDIKIQESYFNNLKKLDELNKKASNARLGSKLVFLLKDFTDSLTDWTKEVKSKSPAGELYSKTWRECRNFILPMNPQKKELEFAVKSILLSYGVNIRIKNEKKNLDKNNSKA
jgi:poly(A) polymerase